MRVYLPATSTIARQLVDSGQLSAPLTGFAVTSGLRSRYDETDAETDTEELEYAALTLAARASLRLIDGDLAAWRRRLVLATDVADGQVSVRDDLDDGVITVAAAAAAILRADLGDESAQDVVDDAEGNELSWYATQELSALLELD
jgi:hypothetical protein